MKNMKEKNESFETAMTKTLSDEFTKKWIDGEFDSDFGDNPTPEKVLDWFLSLRDSELTTLAEKVREMKIKTLLHPLQILDKDKVHSLDNYNAGFDQSLSDVLSLITSLIETK